LKQLAESEASEIKLSERLKNYRRQLELRDQLLFSMVDTLMRDYERVLNQGMLDSEKSTNAGLIQQNNLLTAIHDVTSHRATEEWPEFSLSTSDYFRMYLLADRIEEFMIQNGEKISSLYNDEAEMYLHQSRENISMWKSRIEIGLWASVSAFMQAKQIETEELQSKADFLNAFTSYIDRERSDKPLNPFDTQSYSEYEMAKDFWSTYVMDQWGDDAVDSGLLSFADYGHINDSLDAWQQESKPLSMNLFLILGFGASLILALCYTVFKLY
jgi:hypothetical protein